MRIERDLELPAVDPADLWRALTDPEVLADWLADDAELDPRPGGRVAVTDAEHGDREGEVTEVEPGRRLRWDWWPVGDPDDASAVELVVLPVPGGSRLRVTETALQPVRARLTAGSRPAARGWERRTVLLAATSCRLSLAVRA